ncbi:TonB-dependent receptor plug domain-containing protein [Desulfoplanes formicivorans]|uniref:TonB-denpendent receptor n=1 Tax=Desulfoplanes formicivorans TaxID=1592317 RepID=A0A194AGW5_9BACT|nr:TonB-dependent receptor [Desulfoplanes formicivorans]GAU08326.1 TonB-denpendent receptor [Desulfoplanes formicivorans]
MQAKPQGHFPCRTIHINLFRTMFSIVSITSLCMLILQARALAASASTLTNLKHMDLEELLAQEVSSASKTPEKYFQTGAAIYVITSQDIQRSTATTIPDLLRMVPGLQVARIDANKWAVSSRGFNGRFANKLQVLVDGRSVYSPSFSGTFWDLQDMVLEDIERIEVIRGPGASLWGANAVNGVVNIITKKAEDTLGSLVSSLVGTEDQVVQARHGGLMGMDTSYRIYFKGRNADTGGPIHMDPEDQWNKEQGGFRIDWNPLNKNSATLQGDIFTGAFGENINLLDPATGTTGYEDKTIQKNGGNIRFRFERNHSETSSTSFQIYYDRLKHDEYICLYQSDIIDADIQHSFDLSPRHHVLVGGELRYLKDSFKGDSTLGFTQNKERTALYTGFIQDRIDLAPDMLQLTLGAKFEYSDEWGDAVEPTARIVMTPNAHNTLWASVSRAVRSPSRGEQSVLFSAVEQVPKNAIPIPLPPGPPDTVPVRFTVQGSKDYDKEWVTAYELGYRIMPTDTFSLDIAGFYNEYDDLRTVTTHFQDGTINAQGMLEIPVELTNKMDAQTYGAEITLEWQPRPFWRVEGAYTFLNMHFQIQGNEYDSHAGTTDGDSPQNQISIRSLLDLGHNVQLDLWGRYVDELTISDEYNIPAYTTLDARLAWSPTPNVELSLVGQNLLEKNHQEYAQQDLNVAPTSVQRSMYAKITFTF